MHWVHRHIIPQAYSSLPFGIERRLLEQLPPLEQSPSPPSAGLGFQLGGGATKICSQQRPFGLARGVRGGYLLGACVVAGEVAVVRLHRHERVRSGAYLAGRARALATGTASESARRRSMQRRASSPVERDRHGEVV